jgi:hypothetical protein
LPFLAAIAALLSTAEPCQGMAMVYYGSESQDFARIAAHPPQLLVPGDIPTLAANAAPLHASGITLLAYIPTGWAGTNGAYGGLANVEALVDQAMDAGADGIFFDEASSDATPGTAEGSYYAALWHYVKSGYGAGKLVATNPGVGAPDPSCFDVSDVVCLECEWAAFDAGAYRGIGPGRVWGLDSAADCGNLDGGQAQAVTDTAEAKRLGVGHFYATSEYIDLPAWYEAYVQTAGVCGADAGSVDAGLLDGGPVDAGRVDAGIDGGAGDGGPVRATPDGGGGAGAAAGPAPGESGQGGTAPSGCGCSAAGGDALLPLCLLLAALGPFSPRAARRRSLCRR